MRNKYFKGVITDTEGMMMLTPENQVAWLTKFCDDNGYDHKEVDNVVRRMSEVAEEAAEALDIPISKIMHIISVVGFDVYLKYTMDSIIELREKGE